MVLFLAQDALKQTRRLLVALPAVANDSSFGGAGALPMPIKNDAIRMVEEHVVIERTGNLDIITMEMNMFSQGIDTAL